MSKRGLTYFELYPDAQITVCVPETHDPRVIPNPEQVRRFLLYAHDADIPTKWLRLEHRSLIKYTVVLYFEGLDKSRFHKYHDILPTFASISSDIFPIDILAHEKSGIIVPANHSFFGYSNHKKQCRMFKNISEMVLSYRKMYDNGYPLPATEETDKLKRPLRCDVAYGVKELTPEEFATFKELPSDSSDTTQEIIAIDCEMVFTEFGSELARLSVIDYNGKQILDVITKPLGTVTNYMTEKSGITAESFEGSEFFSNQGPELLSRVANKNTIIIGHSLENDLRALHVTHQRCIDTALLYNGEIGWPKKPSLEVLYSKYIKKPFRTGEGHDSSEDARAAFELVHFALQHPVYEVDSTPQIPKMFQSLLKKIHTIKICAPLKAVPYNGAESEHITYETETDYPEKLVESIGTVPFLTGIFLELSRCETDDATEIKWCKHYDHVLKEVIEHLTSQTMLLIYTGNGNLGRLKLPGTAGKPGYDPARKVEFEACRVGQLWVHCTKT